MEKRPIAYHMHAAQAQRLTKPSLTGNHNQSNRIVRSKSIKMGYVEYSLGMSDISNKNLAENSQENSC